MSQNNDQVRILWISDIHFFCKYEEMTGKNRKYLDYYFEQFRAKVKFEHTVEAPFSHIFLTGDLAQQGTKADYNAFMKMFLVPLLQIFLDADDEDTPQLITIPGNHDVNWNNGAFMDEYIRNTMPDVHTSKAGRKKMKIHARAQFLADNPDKFHQLFKDYTSFVRESIPSTKPEFQRFFAYLDDPLLDVQRCYRENGMYGYLADHRRSLLLVLFNTAWFSLGGKFNKMYAEQLMADPGMVKDMDNINLILKTKDAISEYNNQVSGVNFITAPGLDMLFENYTDYITLSVMHHSMNWFQWQEYYTYDESKKDNAWHLQQILKYSNVLLTGHEHVPVGLPEEIIFEDTLHLKGGCFLFENQDDGLDLNYSWFAVLTIDTANHTIRQRKYEYQTPRDNWEMDQEHSYSIAKKSRPAVLTAKRRDQIIASLVVSGTAEIPKYLAVLNAAPAGPLQRIDHRWDHQISMYEAPGEKGKDLFFFAHRRGFYSLLDSPAFIEFLQDLITQSKDSFDKLHFVVADLFVEGNLPQQYEVHGPRDELLEAIAKKADTLFNVFRCNFFVKFEKFTNLPSEIESFRKFSKLRMINHVLPFWMIEKLDPKR